MDGVGRYLPSLFVLLYRTRHRVQIQVLHGQSLQRRKEYNEGFVSFLSPKVLKRMIERVQENVYIEIDELGLV